MNATLLFLTLLTLDFDTAITDCQRFPSVAMCTEAKVFNRQYHRQVESHLKADPLNFDHWQAVLYETDRLYSCWDWCSVAQRSDYDAYTLQALRELRERIGTASYLIGRLPFPIPQWALQPID